MVVVLGPVRIAVQAEGSRVAERAAWRLRGLDAGTAPTHTLELREKAEESFGGAGVDAAEGLDLRMAPAVGGWSVASRDVVGTVGPRSARLVLGGTPTAVESALRAAASLWLPPAGGLLVHAASAARGGRAALFAGRSGIGKSTLANKLARDGWEVFGEEIALVSLDAQGALLHRHPFGGCFPARASAPLTWLAFLDRAIAHRARPVPPAEACARLLACALAQEPAPALEVAAALAARIPAALLALADDSEAARFVKGALEKAS